MCGPLHPVVDAQCSIIRNSQKNFWDGFHTRDCPLHGSRITKQHTKRPLSARNEKGRFSWMVLSNYICVNDRLSAEGRPIPPLEPGRRFFVLVRTLSEISCLRCAAIWPLLPQVFRSARERRASRRQSEGFSMKSSPIRLCHAPTLAMRRCAYSGRSCATILISISLHSG